MHFAQKEQFVNLLACMRFVVPFLRKTYRPKLFCNSPISHRRKGNNHKYDPPYSKKPTQKSFSGASDNHLPEVAALDRINKIISYGEMPQYRYAHHFFNRSIPSFHEPNASRSSSSKLHSRFFTLQFSRGCF